MPDDDTLRSLRAALEVSPANVPLRIHLAQVLLRSGDAEGAEQELRAALRYSPEDAGVKLDLARAYRAQGKFSAAHVILEDLIRDDVEAGRARLEQARTRLAEGDPSGAAQAYRRALEEDPDVADAELAERLGIESEQEEGSPWFEVQGGALRQASESGRTGPRLEPIRPDVDFSDVGGMEELKRDIRKKIIHPLQHPELYRAYGKKAGGGILLYGPPGCGKTHVAKATAGEVSATFLSVGIHDVLEMWIGNSERNLHDVFEMARAAKPCVLFFDEVDALGSNRGDLRGSAGRNTINVFLSELDGLGSDNEGVLVLAATNAPWHMDPAFRRPGRFERVVFVPPPDLEGRVEILRIVLKDKPQDDVDLRAVAKRTEGFSGADLAAVVGTAIEDKLDEAFERGQAIPLTTKDLLKAAKKRKPSVREWFKTARNYVLYANDGGDYDDLKPYIDT